MLNDLFSLSGRTAVVTGGGAGLGRVFSRTLAEAGAAVAVVDVIEEGARQTAAAIREGGGGAWSYRADVGDAEQVAAVARKLTTDLGRVNVLVNNAGVSTPSRPVHEIPVEEWDEVIRVNLRSVFLCTRAIVPLMMAAEGPAIVNISSVVGLQALDPSIISQAAYVASKAGIVGLTLQTAADYGAIGIRANAIAPGWHLGTDLGRRVGNYPTPEAQRALEEDLARRTPLRRTALPDELAGLVLYLASDASAFVTGQVIAHDGGWTIW